MSPQPINRIKPNVVIDFDPAKLASVPHLTALPMTVIAIWSRIDAIIAKTLTNLMHSDFSIVVAMFQAIRNQDGSTSSRTRCCSQSFGQRRLPVDGSCL
jgi:hypothetical protein